jgi:hypothetical protein
VRVVAGSAHNGPRGFESLQATLEPVFVVETKETAGPIDASKKNGLFGNLSSSERLLFSRVRINFCVLSFGGRPQQNGRMERFWGTLEGAKDGCCPEEVIPGIIHL